MPMKRYTATKHPTRRGYTVHDAEPRYQHSEDVEGYGEYRYATPRRLPATFGFYKLKRDAQGRADVLNAAATNT